ncbi:PAS domain-containing protein [Curvivirga sp.]|uniref:PAS domain-containing protein n=1 Tax=Curvivirga sp. TaxID=2856848 RepID=UPI003B5A708E
MHNDLKNLIELSTLSGKLKDAYEYWCNQNKSDKLPHRKAIDPLEIVRILPNVELLRILRNTKGEIIDFQYDLIGETIDHHTCSNRHHQHLSEIPHQNETTNLFQCMRVAGNTHRAIALSMEYMGHDPRIDHAQGIILPLGGDTAEAESILMAVVFIEKADFPSSTE